MNSFNNVTMLGVVTTDPQYKCLPENNVGFCTFPLKVTTERRGKIGIKVEVLTIDVVVVGPQATTCNEYLFESASVLISGRLKSDMKEANGVKVWKLILVAEDVTFITLAASKNAPQVVEAPQAVPGYNPPPRKQYNQNPNPF
jgi:single-stranded DNA-binding protein